MKIVIAGGSGFIGKHLVSHWSQKKESTYWDANTAHECILLSRHPVGPHSYFWNPEKGQIDSSLLEGADLVVNLCGENLLGRWSEKKKQQIRESRYIASQFLCNSLTSLSHPPKLYIGASAIGYYGDRGESVVSESEGPGSGFLAEVCTYWERTTQVLDTKAIRVVLARFGIVLGSGGILDYMVKAFRTGMGGVLGSGKQKMSWIEIEDLCSAMDHVIAHPEISGPVNFTAPEALSNREFTEILGEKLSRPTLLSVPKLALNLFFGEGAEMFLTSINATPKKLLDSGFIFKYPILRSALSHHVNPQ